MDKPLPDTPNGRELAERREFELYALLRDEGVVETWDEFNQYINNLVRQEK
jgi:hypothetical protein